MMKGRYQYANYVRNGNFFLSIYYGSFACLVNESEICHYRFLLFPIFALFVGICFSCFSCTKRYIMHSSQPPFLQKKFCSIKKVAKNNKYKSILVKNFWAFYEPFPSFLFRMFCLFVLKYVVHTVLLPFNMTFLMSLLLSFSVLRFLEFEIWKKKEEKEWLNILWTKTLTWFIWYDVFFRIRLWPYSNNFIICIKTPKI